MDSLGEKSSIFGRDALRSVCKGETLGDGYLGRMIGAVARRVVDDASKTNESLWTNGPANFPTGSIQHFAAAVYRHRSVPVVCKRCETDMFKSVEGERVVDFVSDDDATREVFEDLRDLQLLFQGEALACWVVRCVENENSRLVC